MPDLKHIYIAALLATSFALAPGQSTAQRRKRSNKPPVMAIEQPIKSPRKSVAGLVEAESAPANNAANNPTKLPTDVPIPKGTTPVVQPVENGQINWGAQYIEATGEAVIDAERFRNPAQARAMATRGAVVVAQRNLLEIVKGVHVTSETTVEDMIATKDFIVTRIEGVVKGAQMIGSPQEREGSVTVRLRMPIYAQNGLAPQLIDQLPTSAPSQTAAAPVADTATAVANMRKGLAEQAAAKGPAPKSIAFNLGGKPFDPTMFPVVTDSAGNVLLDTRQLYDPTTGKFPQYLKTSKEILAQLGIKKGLDLLNVLDAKDGKIRLDGTASAKFPWQKILNTIKTVGKLLLLFI